MRRCAAALLLAAALPAGARDVVQPPACSGDVCQPLVAVPGHEPQFSMRGKRTELFVNLLERLHVEPLATTAWYVAASGVRLDYTPGAMERATTVAPVGWGHVQILLRWRIDAANRPVWPERHR